jgi:8-oxo-dGTP pyrophosphatase MutT (NUDIX family)
MKKEYVLVDAQPCFSGGPNVLLVLKNRPGWQKGFLNLLGGSIEPGESPQEAALRELKEESGYERHQHSYVPPILMGKIEGDNEIVHCLRITIDDSTPPEPRDGETEVVRWYPWSLVKDDKRLIPSLRIVLPLMMAKVYDWTIYVKDTFMGKEHHSVQLTIPSNKSKSYYKDSIVTQIITGKRNHNVPLGDIILNNLKNKKRKKA